MQFSPNHAPKKLIFAQYYIGNTRFSVSFGSLTTNQVSGIMNHYQEVSEEYCILGMMQFGSVMAVLYDQYLGIEMNNLITKIGRLNNGDYCIQGIQDGKLSLLQFLHNHLKPMMDDLFGDDYDTSTIKIIGRDLQKNSAASASTILAALGVNADIT